MTAARNNTERRYLEDWLTRKADEISAENIISFAAPAPRPGHNHPLSFPNASYRPKTLTAGRNRPERDRAAGCPTTSTRTAISATSHLVAPRRFRWT